MPVQPPQVPQNPPLIQTHKPRIKLFTINLKSNAEELDQFEKMVNAFMDTMDANKQILQQNSILSAGDNLVVAVAYLEKKDNTQIRVFGGKN